ncbi:hypothetical protein C5167_027243 [Papaver somniferum]|nr:hypothetical protein C5167_027243 [Papaver somniferum]
MMENIWTSFCRDSDCTYNGRTSGFIFLLFTCPCSCVHNGIVICLDALLLCVLFLAVLLKPSARTVHNALYGYTSLEIVSAVYNCFVVLVYLGLGIWILEDCLISKQTGVLPLHQWVVVLFQGFTWLILSLTVHLRGKKFAKTMLRLCSTISCLIAGLLFCSAFWVLVVDRMVSVNIVLDILLLPGAVLLILCSSRGNQSEDTSETGNSNSLYTPLNGGSNDHIEADMGSETPFAKAGFLSKMTFWWLNSLMKSGKEKTLDDADIPKLRKVDRAESCYMLFMDQLNSQKQIKASESPSVLWTMILTLSAGPLLLNAFIKVAEGKQAFEYEGYVLVTLLFFTKCLESLAQRQWYFRSRLIGIQIRSILSAAIYKKQSRLCNSAKLVHSAGQITNYVTVDAYRIGEFPYWFHQTWTTVLQLCIALVILFQAVGLATLAALVVIVLTVLCNTPVAKLQHKFQTNLMTAQDERLKAISEAFVNMKILKLYAWETHFKSVIEGLREEELKWLSVVQLRRAYNAILFWSSPVLVSAATFGACYFLGVPLYASNAFTFLATLRLVQGPVQAIPDVIGVVIQAKVALARIIMFLAAPELQVGTAKQKKNTDQLRPAIFIALGNFSWEENPLKPTLSSINLMVKPGEKVAICGEVGAGKSTMLAAILGEVFNIKGTVQSYGKTAYVSQTAWIQTGSIQDNILFGRNMEIIRYQGTLKKCSLRKDLEMLPFGDLTEIGERGVNLSGGQKQRIQLARALYQDADIYLMDDPFSAVDAHTATNLFNYVMGALSAKTVLLVTHQIDFLSKFDSILVRYRSNTPSVLQGISCTFEGGHKIEIVGRTGSGKTTMIGALFRLVEPVEGKIGLRRNLEINHVIVSIDISTIGLQDLRSRLGIIPQDPILFNGTVRYNLDPLSQHSDQKICEVLGKCQLEEAVREKGNGLDSLVADDGSNWSMGQRQLFCLGRALLRQCRILVLDEATASIDNATDSTLQKTIRVEFADCNVITVAHRIPTVMDCTMVLALSDGKIIEYDEPMKLMNTEESLFAKLVKEYWCRSHSTDSL